MIQIQGLTALQVKLCDKIWSMETQEEILTWFDTLPHRLKIQAYAMLMMITAELIDGMIDDVGVDDARKELDRIMSIDS